MGDEVNAIISGIGGQGILYATSVAVRTALKLGMNFAQSEIHGMAQRYGSIHTEIRIGEDVKSPLILEGTLDLLVSMEPLEAMRYADYVSERTTIVTNEHLIPSQAALLERFRIPKMAEVKDLLESLGPKKLLTLDATRLAVKSGDPITMNVVMLGAASATDVLPFSSEDLRQTLAEVVGGRYGPMNLMAFDSGLAAVSSSGT